MKTKAIIISLILVANSANVLAQTDRRPYIRYITQTGFTYMNAVSVDFNNQNKLTYTGQLQFFAPDLFGSPNRNWGFNAGMSRLKYSGADTSFSVQKTENIMLNQLQQPGQGDLYVQQLNQYNGFVRRSNTSFYFQPMFRIYPKDSKTTGLLQLYAHLHTEILVSRWQSSVNVTTLMQDTAVINGNSIPVFTPFSTQPPAYTSSYKYAYLGAGVTLDFCPLDNAQFFLQPTFGLTSNYPQFIGENRISTAITRPGRTGNTQFTPFYLLRGNYQQSLSDAATAILSVDVRGFIAGGSTELNAALGINIKLEEVFTLVGARTAAIDGRTKKAKVTPNRKTPPAATTPAKQ
ncbi:MAG: hypothetical protein MUC87_08560 [Bacteroidia bacterium]|jgi:hypothetical protein|nr:hypothetical protein [Bacteroidia bacterium]